MSQIQRTRVKLRRELEAPPGLRKFGSGWISGVLGLASASEVFCCALTARARIFCHAGMRALHGNVWFRLGLHVLLLAAFAFSG